ncbi:D-2-hydroxyacid dehydrogenase [Billgrantia ethanolica]|uniref:D-2-hydroxyacid dehydrogenase n=1 Tax=Billgrantia ethanolica TaxID=2733486 RepID=A0ABS9A100_9GAMM|nr:D-2-hydroxyacid dehydrogenase [Halomonas ethanolica]MCE8002451.1 D-2-hydroxyacid dehydrogenase [Halomonas ethanolica]
MRVGLCFPSHSHDDWERKVHSALTELLPGLTLLDCSSAGCLDEMAPEVLVGHEHEVLMAGLSAPPESLRWVQIMSAGVDRLLDAIGPGPVAFRITNVRGIHAQAMVEYLLAVLLHFEKRLGLLVDSQKERRWERPVLGQLAGKRLLVCGAGGIGLPVGTALAGLGVTVEAIARDTSPRGPFRRVHSLSALPQVIGMFDYVVCALPLTDETRGVFDRDAIGAMRDGAIFVNVARGELVDEDALRASLCAGKLAGAALDAFREEPLPNDSLLWATPNLLITPHVAGRFAAGHQLGLAVLRDNMAAYLAGAPLRTEVFPQRGY